MKKNILIALVALLAVTLNGNAQNNTYNMVIEMANGTKITIGPNDVKNISFNNGQLVMTGEDINTLVEQQNQMQARIDYLATVEEKHYWEVQGMIKDIAYMVYNLPSGDSTPDLSNYVTKPELQKDLQDYVNKVEINALATKIADLDAWIQSLQTTISSFKSCQCNK